MNIENFRLAMQVLTQWGFWIMVYGAVTMLVGFIILMCLDIKTIKAIGNFLWN